MLDVEIVITAFVIHAQTATHLYLPCRICLISLRAVLFLTPCFYLPMGEGDVSCGALAISPRVWAASRGPDSRPLSHAEGSSIRCLGAPGARLQHFRMCIDAQQQEPKQKECFQHYWLSRGYFGLVFCFCGVSVLVKLNNLI